MRFGKEAHLLVLRDNKWAFFKRRNMSQNCMHRMEKFKPKVMDLDMLSATEVDMAPFMRMNTPRGKAKMYS